VDVSLVIDGVVASHAGFELGPIDLVVDADVLAVLGPSGCGKTTLLSTVAGLVAPDAGSVSLGGRPLAGRPPEERRIGLVFQDGALFPHMTARENVAYAATTAARVDRFASLLEIEHLLDRRPPALSGGERRRVALARTLAADPDALLLDEPLSSLDAPIRRRLRDELHDLFAGLDVPVVYVTHDQRAATVLGDRLAVLRDGTVEQIGPPSTVLERPATEFVARFTGCENVFEVTIDGRTNDGVDLRLGSLTLRSTAAHDATGTASACVRPARVRVHPASADCADTPNVVTGTVRRRLNEGDGWRMVVALDGADVDLVASLPPNAAASVGDVGATVRVSIPPAAVQLV
jgi:molybdate/tungstate transport system ATP-binding protein